MSKKKSAQPPAQAAAPKAVATKETAFDPALASLFASSSGPVQVPARPTPVAPTTSTNGQKRTIAESNEEQDVDQDTSASGSEDSGPKDDVPQEPSQSRKRRRTAKDADDLESTYLNRLAREEQKELKQKEAERKAANKPDNDTSSEGSDNDELLQDASDIETDDDDENEATETFGENGETLAIPVHESLQSSKTEATKNARTVFLSNVSTKAIKSKFSRTSLLTHLKTVLDPKSNEKIESIRFRSTAFASNAGPKRAAYAKKELMDETALSTNAYVVLSSEAAARKIALRLNGSIILDRHIHADSLANPLKTDNKRCVFVGNLPFVDEETPNPDNPTNTSSANQQRRARAKLPADPEEGLWRVFAKCGKIESVRVVRDKATRVGKGFAYVQFEDGNGVEKALELDGKKFPPLLPRLLRVMRSKGVKKKDARGGRDGSGNGRRGTTGGRISGGRSGNGGDRERSSGGGRRIPKLDGVVFEGYRASSGANKIKIKTKSRGSKPTKNSTRRAAAFRAGGGKKRRDRDS